ncbi:hypothetical protein Acr_11g0006710 [Actinidia rufa]|uniref:Uncharacterized protein n=1 Tax=Actinidia rufa TaxID=165716 RepID=A0A7J0FCF7_9ERIC|nr:hypothetical protein Acr_11g0006710 [Actinidia rufa]
MSFFRKSKKKGKVSTSSAPSSFDDIAWSDNGSWEASIKQKVDRSSQISIVKRETPKSFIKSKEKASAPSSFDDIAWTDNGSWEAFIKQKVDRSSQISIVKRETPNSFIKSKEKASAPSSFDDIAWSDNGSWEASIKQKVDRSSQISIVKRETPNSFIKSKEKAKASTSRVARSIDDIAWSDDEGLEAYVREEVERMTQVNIVERETPNYFVYTLNVSDVKPNDVMVTIVPIGSLRILQITVTGFGNRIHMLPHNLKMNKRIVDVADGIISVTIPK